MKYRVHIAGPDDVIDFDDELEADRYANAVNKMYLKVRDPDSDVLCVATVTEVEEP